MKTCEDLIKEFEEKDGALTLRDGYCFRAGYGSRLIAEEADGAEVPCNVGLSADVVLIGINHEPEYPGEIPEKLWATLKESILTDDKDLILFVFRQIVKDTKRGIIERIGI